MSGEKCGPKRRDPKAALAVAILLLSLAGVPPLPGFWLRLVLYREAIRSGFGYLAVVGAVTSVFALYFYLAPALRAFRSARDETRSAPVEGEDAEWGTRLIVTAVASASILVGLFPEPLMALCRAWALK